MTQSCCISHVLAEVSPFYISNCCNITFALKTPAKGRTDGAKL